MVVSICTQRSLFQRLIVFFLLLPIAALAEQDTLDYLYSPSLPEKQQLLLDRVNIHARSAEFDYAINLSQSLLDESAYLQLQSSVIYGQIMVNHGIIQSAATDYVLGLSVIESGLAFMERDLNPFSLDLVNAIMAKGLTQLALESLIDAEDTFRRAQHITHRQGGVYSADQISIINYITTTKLRQGEPTAADQQQLFSLRVSEQAYGHDSLELLPVLNRLGSYFATRGSTIPLSLPTEYRMQRDLLFKHSVSMYQRSVAIIELNFGTNDLRLVQPLRGLASARMLQVTNRKFAESALERSLSIIQSNPDSDLSDRARALIDLGDLYIITSDNRAAETYLEAWHLLQETPDTQLVAISTFGTPTRLFPRDNPIFYLDRRPDSANVGEPLFVDIEYSVNTAGKVNRVSVLDSNVPNEQVRLLRMRVRGSRFRPRIIDAQVVPTEGLLVHQPFALIRRQIASPDDADTPGTSLNAALLKEEASEDDETQFEEFDTLGIPQQQSDSRADNDSAIADDEVP
jgi:hypothetical protein